ncbi:unnamed protein product, partial [Polarella glacialis]
VVGGESSFSSSELWPPNLAPSSAPKVTPVRCINKFRRVAGPQIQVIQRVEVFPLPGAGADLGDARDLGASRQRRRSRKATCHLPLQGNFHTPELDTATGLLSPGLLVVS